MKLLGMFLSLVSMALGQIERLTTLVQQVLHRLDDLTVPQAKPRDGQFCLPLETVEEFLSMEESLNNREAYVKLVIFVTNKLIIDRSTD